MKNHNLLKQNRPKTITTSDSLRQLDKLDLGELEQVVGGLKQLGQGSDQLIVRSNFSGKLDLEDPKKSWMWNGNNEVAEQDTLFIPL